MPRYTVKATVTVDVEISIEASTLGEANDLFQNNLAVNATLVDVPAENFDVNEDSITEVAVTSTERE